MKRIWVTGGSGFLGQKLQRQLRQLDFEVQSIGREQLGDATQTYQWEKQLSAHEPEVIYHLMGAFDASDEVGFDEANVSPLQALLQAMQNLGGNRIPIFLLGSAAEYGSIPISHQPILENTIPHPVSAYGRSKLRATETARSFRKAGLPVSVVRLFNVFAADMSPRLMPGAVLAQIRHNLTINTGPLDRVRDFLHADVAMLALAQLAKLENGPEIIHLCSGNGWNLRAIVEILAAGKHEIIETPSQSPNDVLSCVGNNDLLTNLIGYRPAVPTADDFARLLTS